MIVIGLLCGAAAGALWALGTPRAPAPWAHGAIVVTDGRLTQEDQWVFTRALRGGRFSTASIGRPVFASGEAIRSADVTLECDASGRPLVLSWHANAGDATAQLVRAVSPAAPLLSTTKAGPSPLRELAKQEYVSDPFTLEGELPSTAAPPPPPPTPRAGGKIGPACSSAGRAPDSHQPQQRAQHAQARQDHHKPQHV